MNQIVNSQSLLFITCIEIGIIMGAFFDLIRISRKIVKHPDFFVQLEDLIYWVICALIGFYLLYINNYAAIRPFVFIGILLGAILYFASFSLLFMKVATVIIHYVKTLVRQLIRFLAVPVKWIIRIIGIPIKHINEIFMAVHSYQKKRLRKLKRKWRYKKADLRTEFILRKKKK